MIHIYCVLIVNYIKLGKSTLNCKNILKPNGEEFVLKDMTFIEKFGDPYLLCTHSNLY